MGNPVVHFEIQSTDPTSLRPFYEDLFGWAVQVIPPMNYGIVDTNADGAGILGGIGPASPNLGARGTFYVSVPDINATLAQIEEAGGTTVIQRTEMPQVTIAMFTDPQENLIGLVEEPEEG